MRVQPVALTSLPDVVSLVVAVPVNDGEDTTQLIDRRLGVTHWRRRPGQGGACGIGGGGRHAPAITARRATRPKSSQSVTVTIEGAESIPHFPSGTHPQTGGSGRLVWSRRRACAAPVPSAAGKVPLIATVSPACPAVGTTPDWDRWT